jgi:uncharacterized protein YvpB
MLFMVACVMLAVLAFALNGIGQTRADGEQAVAQGGSDVVFASVDAEVVTAEADGLSQEAGSIALAALAEIARAVNAVDAASAANVVGAANAANAGWHEIDGARYYFRADGTVARGTVEIGVTSVTFDDEGRWMSSRLDVPYISQLPEMPSGCEVTSVTMMLNHAGINVSKEEMAAQLPYSNDPSQGFTGSVYEDGGYGYGGIVWPSALLEPVRRYQESVVDLTGESWETVRGFVDEGRSVCIWFTENGLDHTVLLVGYSADTVWVNDPLNDKDVALDTEIFFQRWAQNSYRALSYE